MSIALFIVIGLLAGGAFLVGLECIREQRMLSEARQLVNRRIEENFAWSNAGSRYRFRGLSSRLRSKFTRIQLSQLSDSCCTGVVNEGMSIDQSRTSLPPIPPMPRMVSMQDKSIEGITNSGGIQFNNITSAIGEVSLSKLAAEQCTICLECFITDDLSQSSDLVLLPCGHVFHDPCIDNWLRFNRLCPVCKADLVIMDAEMTTAIVSNNVLRSRSWITRQLRRLNTIGHSEERPVVSSQTNAAPRRCISI